jgi:predicted ATP-grasp superfamily ATP-dependent carboligase
MLRDRRGRDAPLRNPAVVTNSEAAGIGVIHSLARAGVDMIIVERKWPPLLGRFSHFPKVRVLYRSARGESLADILLKLSDRFEGKGVLFPSIDHDLEALIAAREQLSERYHVPAASHIGLKIFDRNWQYDVAERIGCPLPRHVTFVGGELPDITGFRFPLIVKPASRALAAGANVFRLQTLGDPLAVDRCLKEIARDHRGRGFQIAEEIPGESDQLYTVASYSNAEGRVLRTYSGRKITLHPYCHGYTSVAETLQVPAEVVRSAQSLLTESGFHGISQVEFKFDARDGRYKLLEINGRAWLWVKLAAASGVNLPLIQYYDLTGDPRLGQAVEAAQDDAYFFVYDAHVKLNRMPAERARIEELRRTKTLVPAVYHEGEWLLGLAYRGRSLLKQLRAAAF